MTNELIGTVFLSEKRKSILLMLVSNGPTSIDDIKDSLTGTTSAIMAQIKILLEQGLIEQIDDEYKLTYIGKIILKKIRPLVETLNVVEENKDYWENRDLSSIPERLLDRIGELGDVTIHEPDLSHLFEPPEELLTSFNKTTHVHTFYSYFCPSCPCNYKYLADRGVKFDLMLTRAVYERFKDEFAEQYNIVKNSKNSNLYIYDDNDVKQGALSVTDDLLLLAFFSKGGVFDHKKVISFEESAKQWGLELFSHYKEKAELVD
ncbi:winged helix-turn-helix domain-containing protein [Methanohalophilus sp. RSK]|uniref:helix-turn-helix transcriptional regulator n=1 Tax=Methanohalophilus sp. RSK TaxID=2485783 RepID=UPI000F43D39C|nr:winged helix-turn-helix domain-containing protein [Methanohalophilus sp. RSK]RNI13757.1 winged helix-turn-helix domain-containing protein [Methanohalophilus sp. RSK]